jgi:hypothetical protein
MANGYTDPMDDPEWESMLTGSNLNLDTTSASSDIDRAKKILAASVPVAAQTIVNLAQSGQNETTKLKAAQYIVDKFMPDATPTQESWETMLATVVGDAENLANGSH